MFRFSLQAALDAAAANEDTAGRTFGRAQGLLDEARAALHVVAERARDVGRLRDARDRIPAAAAGWIALEEYAGRLMRLRSVRTRALATARASAARALEGLQVARRKRLALERLRERKLAEYRAREALREAAEFDESNAAHGRTPR